uniref:Uncharacterized protein n=1 Tax=Anguilla anguilla TaxID=7936 RepID=A0A0E9QK01_ANGAN
MPSLKGELNQTACSDKKRRGVPPPRNPFLLLVTLSPWLPAEPHSLLLERL